MDNKVLRKVQLIQLEILKEVVKVCEQHNIHYFLEGGTLLGAVRHQGFIPLDDDLDIGMLREDYEKFIRIAPSSLSQKYELLNWYTDPGYGLPFCKVIKRGTVYLEEKASRSSSKNGIYIDIFPYDNFPDNKISQCHQGLLLMFYRTVLRAKCHYKTWNSHGRFYFYKWLKNTPFRILSIFFTKNFLTQKYDETAMWFNKKDCSSYYLQGISRYGKFIFPKECFNKFIPLHFENETFNAPVGYDLYLKIGYGNYMTPPPVQERENRHGIIEIDFGE